ncbi:MAG: DNA primase noncatalytic subunit PriX [Desulfurococcales archaeon]|nr:DNA primase noncatalytic subunit PriX [Desulfurococcales archaeon]
MKKNKKWDEVLGGFVEKWVCGHLEDCLLREYGVPARLGILDWVEVWHRILSKPKQGHHLSVAGYRDRSHTSMVMDRIGFDFDSDPHHLDKALGDALALIRYLKDSYGVDGALQFTGRRGYRVWVFLKHSLDPGIYPEFVKSLIAQVKLGTLDTVAALDVRHLFRIPYTIHEVTGKRTRFLDPKSLEPIRVEDWDYQLYEPLDPGMVKIVRVVVEPPQVIIIRKKHKGNESANRYGWIERILEAGLPDGRKRFILWIASRYLVNVKRLSIEEALGELNRFLDKSCENYGNCSKVYQSWIRSVLRAVKDRGYKPPSLRTLSTKHPDLYQLIQHNGNPSSAHGIPEPIASFLEETGLTEFTYQDVKSWIEAKKGRVTAGEWSKISRLIRRLAEEGKLGRKYYIDGRWVDHGPGPVAEASPRRVRFYMLEKTSQ